MPEFLRAKPCGKPMPTHIARGNATRSRVRNLVDHVFATERRRMDLIGRSVSLVRATACITLADLACAMRRVVCIERRGGAA